MAGRLAVLPQYLLPKHALTRFAGGVASRPRGVSTQRLIRWFVRKYGVRMDEAAEPDIARYATFNDFFTRALKPGVRPLADAELICPVDGAVSQFGAVEAGRIVQAKGHVYSATALLGGDAGLAARFLHGAFATLYLSPKDYHRIHMPCAGRLARMVYVPGDLFSVNPTTARGVPGLFARNERVVCVFDGEGEGGRRPFAIVLVGATIVGGIETVWHGVVNPPRPKPRRVLEWRYDDRDVRLAQGDEMGRFLLGSTVVLLFASPRPAFVAGWAPGRNVRLGEAMATPRADGDRHTSEGLFRA